MDGFASQESNERSPVTGMVSQAATVLGDMLEIVELQAKLAKSDALEASRHAALPLGQLVLGGCAALSSFPVLAFGLASGLTTVSPLNGWQAQVVVGAVLGALAALMIFRAIHGLRRAAAQFQQSGHELVKNFDWAKRLVRSATSEKPKNEKSNSSA